MGASGAGGAGTPAYMAPEQHDPHTFGKPTVKVGRAFALRACTREAAAPAQTARSLLELRRARGRPTCGHSPASWARC